MSARADPRGPARRAGPGWRRPGLLVLPLLAFLSVFYLVPVVLMLARASGPGLDFAPLAAALASGVAAQVFGITLKVAVVTTLATLLLGYPLALFTAIAPPRVSRLLLAAVMIPFWSSILVRSYAWMVLLGRQGLVNDALIGLGMIDTPMRLLNTSLAVYVGMIHILLPFMVLPIYATLSAIDGRLVWAAENLGARAPSVLRHVIVPLSLPGVCAGVLVVFILCLGFYVTPALLGGPGDMMASMLIAQEVDLYNWDLASAYAGVLLVVTLLIVAAFGRLLNLERVMGAGR
ncbi:ABC transporter permease (plasmid) [Paroceanicella profunda]|uniref:ABC transporter permease n=1 Tax=Paroceanicella profunda TaxID=2579971 RepID=A0A5B8G5J2_9RHOB|nr:ABC transporter permease [Paroceanicella profunda]QDL94602.1 ABC transporter permease [Paroceanicella profunda]